MDYIVDAAEMQRADENTIRYFGVPQLVLMERAALEARNLILRRWPGIFSGSARILAAVGNGNNGGDGAALARLFFLMGHSVDILVSGEEEKYSPALKIQIDILNKYIDEYKKDPGENGAALRIVTDREWKEKGRLRAEKYDLVVDALFGVGLSRPIAGIYEEKIAWLNGLSAKKAALDIPSGVSSGDGSVLGCAYRAELTVTFGFMKRGMLLYPGRALSGEKIVADIGITKESFRGVYPAGITIDREDKDTAGRFLRRRPDGHKGSFGKVLLFAGSAGAPGAALLAGEAVLRSGAGMLLMVSVPENREAAVTRLPEAMYRVLDENTDWEELLKWCDAVAIGPGIGQDGLAEKSMEKILTLVSERKMHKPLVLDADGLNLVAASEKLSGLVKEYTGAGGIVIMTPHMAEFARLLCCGMKGLQAERMEKLEGCCRETGAILVSKDAATVAGYIGEAGAFHYYINQTGNSGMATAGSGDVLSGITGALTALAAVRLREKEQEGVAEKEVYFQAAYSAVYLHGLAGDRAAREYGEASLKAGDLLAVLPELLKEFCRSC